MKTTSFRIFLLLCLLLSTATSSAVTFDWANVGNPNNANDIHGDGFGGVNYTYLISKHEVTNGQYIEFLNSVATLGDAYNLYHVNMASSYGGIDRSGAGIVGDPYAYSAKGGDSNWFNRPVNFVSWGDSARFINWLHNGQPTGLQDATTTEDGAYFLNGVNNYGGLAAITRESDAQYWIPTEDEWYKAAYYDPNASVYYDYPTGSDTAPSNNLIYPDQGNNANYYNTGYTLGSPYYTSEVAEFKNSASPYGTYDQGGNVWEWNETLIHSSFRGLRGGSFDIDGNHLHANDRSFNEPEFEYIFVGFRVATVPEPSTLLVGMTLMLGMCIQRQA